MTPTTPRESRNASSSSPSTTIFFGGPSASGNSSDNKTGSQKRRNSSPIPVPGPLSVRNLLSSARSMGCPPEFCLALPKLGAGRAGRQRISRAPKSLVVSVYFEGLRGDSDHSERPQRHDALIRPEDGFRL